MRQSVLMWWARDYDPARVMESDTEKRYMARDKEGAKQSCTKIR